MPSDKDDQVAEKSIEEQRADLVEQRREMNDFAATLKDAQDNIKKDMTALKAAQTKMRNKMDVYETQGGRDFSIDEIRSGDTAPIEVISERDFYDVKDEKIFMEEMVCINVNPSGEPGSLPVVVITVNGTNQAIVRGRNQWVKRKYIEAMARSKITTYLQDTPNPATPDVINMLDTTALTYGFSVVEDRNPNGLAWLQTILAQPA